MRIAGDPSACTIVRRARSSPGSASTAATTCRGSTRAIRTASGCPRSCCSRRRSRPCCRTTSASSRAFPMFARLLPHRSTACSRTGAGSATTGARTTCMRPRRRSSTTTAARFRAMSRRIAALPGIGRSTAAAIAAFAFGARAPILDGNVKRVLARHRGIEGFPGAPKVERALWAAAESLLPATDIERYTQGMMDLGATVCTRTRRAASCVRSPSIASRGSRDASPSCLRRVLRRSFRSARCACS